MSLKRTHYTETAVIAWVVIDKLGNQICSAQFERITSMYAMYNALWKYKYKGNICTLYFLVDGLVGTEITNPPWRHSVASLLFSASFRTNYACLPNSQSTISHWQTELLRNHFVYWVFGTFIYKPFISKLTLWPWPRLESSVQVRLHVCEGLFITYRTTEPCMVHLPADFIVKLSACWFHLIQWEAFSLRLCAIRWRTMPDPWNADNPLLILILLSNAPK